MNKNKNFEGHPSKFKVKLNPRKIDDDLLPNSIGLEARVFFISEYNGKGFSFVTDEIKFPYKLLNCSSKNLKVESNIDRLFLKYSSGQIRFFNTSGWSNIATERFSKEDSIEYFREGYRVLKGNAEILETYDVSIEDII